MAGDWGRTFPMKRKSDGTETFRKQGKTMEDRIKPIQTYYRGYRFRSRLEARWAVFFDALGVKFEYESQGFILPSGEYYLPDFKVECWGYRGEIGKKSKDLYIEVKGYMTQKDADKIIEFSGGHPILIVGNIPEKDCITNASSVGAYNQINGIDIYPFNYYTIDGDYFGAFPTAKNGKFYLMGDDCSYHGNVNEAEIACEIARQARFEHGETPLF